MRPTTEQLHPDAKGIDARPAAEGARILADGQAQAAHRVVDAIPAICEGARAMANTLRSGGTLYYVAAGSSGLMAAADAMELGGTYDVPADRIRILMAGGLPTTAEMPGATEDQIDDVLNDISEIDARDTAITVSASGTTAFTIAAAKAAKDRGATVIGIANNAGSPLLGLSHHAVLVETPPEVVSGSTRMGAGTAQKIALNMLSTLMAMDLGHIHDGMMVNVRADNDKLRQRAENIVMEITGAPDTVASEALSRAEGHVKTATLLAAGVATIEDARRLLDENQGRLRGAMSQIN